MVKFYTLLFLMLCLYSCKKDEVNVLIPEKDRFTEYFGLQVGRYIEYDVIEIHHDDAVDIHDTLKYILKVKIEDTLIDNKGDIAYKYERSYWDSYNQIWQMKDVWVAKITDKYAQLVEENIIKSKLYFPVSFDFEWNRNLFNDQEEDIVKYSSVHEAKTLTNILFDSTLTVSKDTYFTLVDFRKDYEVYAKNIGLISKTYKNLRISNFDTLKVKTGDELFYTVVKFGIE